MIAVAVSGGVDSLYALAKLREETAEVVALHGRFRTMPPDADPVPGLAENCRRLGVPLYVADLRAAFGEAVMEPFAKSYAAGLTPNPCALCNARIKFGLLLDEALRLGADLLATGHYARRVEHPVYGAALGAAQDQRKDQSYFLALTPKERLLRARFPLARLIKEDARTYVRALGLTVPLPKESQEICFVPDNDYRAFVRACGLSLSGPGQVELAGTRPPRVIGRHAGLWQYTEGQRRGLGIAWSEPLYVVGKDAARNVLLAGTAADLACSGCEAGDVNVLVEPRLWPEQVRVRVRYRQQAAPAVARLAPDLTGRGGSVLSVTFAAPQATPAPGQVAAVYDDAGVLLAGGVLRGCYLLK